MTRHPPAMALAAGPLSRLVRLKVPRCGCRPVAAGSFDGVSGHRKNARPLWKDEPPSPSSFEDHSSGFATAEASIDEDAAEFFS